MSEVVETIEEVQPIEEAEPEPEPHRGYFTISRGLLQNLGLELPEPDFGTLPTTAVKANFRKLHKKLLLPKAYQIIKLFYNPMQGTWLVIVEAEPIPVAKDSAEMPRLDLFYNKDDETGKVTLLRIQAVYTQQVQVVLLTETEERAAQ